MLDRRTAAGAAWGSAAALLTAGWWVMTRQGVTTAMDPYDSAALRFAVSGALLAPVLWRRRQALAAVPAPLLAVMALCAGAPYSLLVAGGLRLAEAGNGGALVSGALPLFTTLLSVLVLRETVAAGRWIGLAVILAGMLGLAGAAASAAASLPLFLTAGLMWAGFTVTLRLSRLPVDAAIAVVSVASAALYLPGYLLIGADTVALDARTLPHALYQGVVSAIVAVYCFGRAVQALGAARAALFGAVVPVLANLLGAVLLGEVPTGSETAAVATIAVGAGLASGGLRLPGRAANPL